MNAFTVCAELEVTRVSGSRHAQSVCARLAAVMYEYTRRMCYAYLKTGQQMAAVLQSVARRQLLLPLLSQPPTLRRLYTDDRSSLGTCTRLEPNSASLPPYPLALECMLWINSRAEYPYLSRLSRDGVESSCSSVVAVAAGVQTADSGARADI